MQTCATQGAFVLSSQSRTAARIRAKSGVSWIGDCNANTCDRVCAAAADGDGHISQTVSSTASDNGRYRRNIALHVASSLPPAPVFVKISCNSSADVMKVPLCCEFIVVPICNACRTFSIPIMSERIFVSCAGLELFAAVLVIKFDVSPIDAAAIATPS